MAPFVVAVLGLGLLAAVCGSGSHQLSPASSATAAPQSATTPRAFPTTSDSVLGQALLSVADLSGDWTEESLAGGTLAEETYCGKSVDLAIPSAATVLTSVGSDGTRMLVEGFTRYGDARAASGAIRSLRDALQDCNSLVSTDGVEKTEWHVESVGGVDLGDDGITMKGSAAVLEGLGSVTGYFFSVQQGEVVLTLAEISSATLDSSEPVSILRTAFAKLSAAGGQ